MFREKRAFRDRSLLLFLFLSLALLYVLVVNAWVVDDAYITFRTVDNFIHGYGLTWNVGERVQTYTHPLWMFVMSLFFSFTSDVFYTSIVLNLLLAIAAALVASRALTNRFHGDTWKLPLYILALISSKAIIDYASSGLENALSYFLASLFFARLLSMRRRSSDIRARDLGLLFLLTSLSFTNHPDTVLLYLPILVYLVVAGRSLGSGRLVRLVMLTTLPATLWILFSLVYYGFPFPNTAYAKMISTGFPVSWRISRGLEYLVNSIYWDTASYVILVAAVVMCFRSRAWTLLAALAGILLYIAFVVHSAASATHMSGRFFAVPFFIATMVFVDRIPTPRFATIASVVLAIYIAWSPVSSAKFGTSAYHAYPQNNSYIDTKWYVAKEGAALINWRPGKRLPDHEWYHYGEKIRGEPGRIHVGGAFHGPAIGYVAFAAGPGKYILDTIALGDPLLARLPALRPLQKTNWRSGHFVRAVPAGYIESVQRGRNLIAHRNIGLYYEKIRNITRGPLFRWDRLRDIWNINLGIYDNLLSDYEFEESRGVDVKAQDP